MTLPLAAGHKLHMFAVCLCALADSSGQGRSGKWQTVSCEFPSPSLKRHLEILATCQRSEVTLWAES